MTVTIFGIILVIAIAVTAVVLFINRRAVKNRHSDAATNHEQDPHRIYVGNLHYRIKEKDLLSAFTEFGLIKDVKIIKNRKTGRSKGFAFITFAEVQQANNALVMHGKDMQGRTLVVRIAKVK